MQDDSDPKTTQQPTCAECAGPINVSVDQYPSSNGTVAKTMSDASPDNEDRLKDFFARHGGASERAIRKGQSAGGVQGWTEAYANDGYTLRCDWSTFGSRDEMKYSELPPTKSLKN